MNEYNLPIFLQDCQYGKPISALMTPELKGYVFKGWKDAPDTMPAEDLYITPIWVPAGYDDSEDTESSDDSKESSKLPIYLGAGAGAVVLVGAAALLFMRMRP